MSSTNASATPPAFDEAYLNEYSGDILIAESISFAVLTTVVLILRFYAKRFTMAKFGLDDIFLGAAYVVNLGMCAIGIIIVQIGGVGRHLAAVEARDPSLIVEWAKCLLAFEIVYFISVALPKLAILCLYLRVFNWKGEMRTAAITLLAMVAATSLSLVITACFQCRPLAFWWDRTIPGGSCIDIQLFFHAQSIPGFVLDTFIMALPIRTIWSLKLPFHRRVALLAVFLVASFGMVASVIRAVTFFGTAAFTDSTWASVELVGWSIIETSTYIITACLPHLRPLISHYMPQRLKDMVRKTISSAGHSLSTSRPRKAHGTEEDTMELTKTTGKNSDGDDSSSTEEPWVPNDSGAYKYTPSPETQFESMKSADIISGTTWGRMRDEAWRTNEIRVTTQIVMERHPSVKENK